MSENETLKKLYIALKKAQDRIAQLEAAPAQPIAVLDSVVVFPRAQTIHNTIGNACNTHTMPSANFPYSRRLDEITSRYPTKR
jgi:hypothetical protein